MHELEETNEIDGPDREVVSAAALPETSMQIRAWALWLMINLIVATYFLYALFAPASTIKSAWLPGESSHGHYQIELDCNACHSQATEDAAFSGDDVMQDACIKCHGQQLKSANDTHPAKKFNDPTNADRLLILDAQNCLTCHREHVPDRTLSMGVTVPSDYCWHCHQDVAKSRPSHSEFAFDSCATAGCHNYHDNRALYEKYLSDHYGEPDHKESALVAMRNLLQQQNQSTEPLVALTAADIDAKPDQIGTPEIVDDWESTAHASAGVNCRACHGVNENNDDQTPQNWSDSVSMETCGTCHQHQVDTFVAGKHGMRLAVGMSPMTPELARLPMHADAAHRTLTCNTCHPGHRFDTQFAAAEACRQCHADDHTAAYNASSHAGLWNDELSGAASKGSGVSCATCHMPRLVDGDNVSVNHDQNSNLRPNEIMARQVCGACHSLEYALSALADQGSIDSCFGQAPKTRIESVDLAHDWFVAQEAKRQRRKNAGSKSGSSTIRAAEQSQKDD